MKTFIRVAYLILLVCLFSSQVQAQEVRRYPTFRDLTPRERLHYNENPANILPDAGKCFDEGDYNRAIMLCSMHWAYYGDGTDESAGREALDTRAKRCYDLSREMNTLVSDNKQSEARQKAGAILEINPKDAAALDVLNLPLKATGIVVSPEVGFIREGETLQLSAEVLPADATNKAVVWHSDDQALAAVDRNGLVTAKEAGVVIIRAVAEDGNWTAGCEVTIAKAPEPEEPVRQPEPEEPIRQPEPEEPVRQPEPKAERIPHTTFVAKVGAGMLTKGSFSPELSLGVYDLLGSSFGAELGGFYCPGASLHGLDVSAVARVSNVLYFRAGVGFFSSTGASSGTKGLGAVAGPNVLIGDHFCLEAGVRYFPTIQVKGTETVSTGGTTYSMPTVVTVKEAGIAPFVKIGWAF